MFSWKLYCLCPCNIQESNEGKLLHSQAIMMPYPFLKVRHAWASRNAARRHTAGWLYARDNERATTPGKPGVVNATGADSGPSLTLQRVGSHGTTLRSAYDQRIQRRQPCSIVHGHWVGMVERPLSSSRQLTNYIINTVGG